MNMTSARNRSYWNKDMETIDANQLIRLERKKLNHTLRYVGTRSSFYTSKFKLAGMRQLDLGHANFSEIPFTTKDELRVSQERSPPFGDYMCVPNELVNRIHRTSGTTGRPLFIALTKHDIDVMNECGARAYWSAGLRPGIKVVHCMNYSLWMGGYSDHSSLEKVGAAVAPFGVGQSRFLLNVVKLLRTDAISATTSYPMRLANVAREELNMDPRDLGLKLGLLGGEIGLSVPGFRQMLEDTWGMRAVDANYGLADVLSIFAAECDQREGLHFLGQGAVLCELINPETGETKQITEYEEGELVYTNLDKEGQPLVRYRSGDIVRIITVDKCACGRTGFRFKALARTSDVLKVKGINIYVSAIHEIISSFSPELNGEFQIILENPPPLERLMISAELGQAARPDRAHLAKDIAQTLKEKLGIHAELQLLTKGSLPRYDGKAERIVRLYS